MAPGGEAPGAETAGGKLKMVASLSAGGGA
jgi:hypothetical protein